jgi:hypothetical protein
LKFLILWISGYLTRTVNFTCCSKAELLTGLVNMEIVFNEGLCCTCFGSGKLVNHRLTGDRMREKRKLAGVTAVLVARRCGWTPAYVSMLESGKKPWDTGRVEKYLTALVNDES